MNIEILVIGGGGLMLVVMALMCSIYAIAKHSPRNSAIKAAGILVIIIFGMIIVWDFGLGVLRDARTIPKSSQYYPILPK